MPLPSVDTWSRLSRQLLMAGIFLVLSSWIVQSDSGEAATRVPVKRTRTHQAVQRTVTPKVSRPALPVTQPAKAPLTLTPLQQQLKRIEALETKLIRLRTEWYEKARDVAFLQQITQEAQLTVDLDVAPHGTRLIFLEEYGPALSDDTLMLLCGRTAGNLRGVTYNDAQVTTIRDRGREQISDMARRQVALQIELKALLDEIDQAAAAIYELRNRAAPASVPATGR